MPMMVQTSTDQVPELETLIEQRRAHGLDTYDEWWEGVYRIVTGPSPEHGELVLRLGAVLSQRAAERGLSAAAPVNLGIDKINTRVPDLALYAPDTPRTSRAFLATAVLVVEILSPGERAGEKLPFYAERGVHEYLEVDLEAATCRLLRRDDQQWVPTDASRHIELSVADVIELL